MRLRLVILVLLLVAVTGSLLGWQYWDDLAPPLRQVSPPLTLAQSTPAAVLRAPGFIQVDAVTIAPEISGMIEQLHAHEGDFVSTGQVLVQLDTTTLDVQMQQTEALVRAAEAQLAEVKAGLRPQEIQIAEAAVAMAREDLAGADKAVQMAQGDVAAARANVQAAQAGLARLRSLPDPRDVELAQERLNLAQERVVVLARMRDQTGGAEQRGDVPSGSYEAAEAAVAEAQVTVRLLQILLEDLKAGAHIEEIRAAEAAIRAAQARVEAAQAQVLEAQRLRDVTRARLRRAEIELEMAKEGAADEDRAMAQAKVKETLAAKEILRIQRGKATLHAPLDGFVVEQVVNVGERILPGSVILRLADLDTVKLTVYVSEVELAQLHLGQPVQVVASALPQQGFPGQVAHISSQAEFTPRNIPVREQRTNQVFAVTVEVENLNHMLKPGMSADAIFANGEIGEVDE